MYRSLCSPSTTIQHVKAMASSVRSPECGPSTLSCSTSFLLNFDLSGGDDRMLSMTSAADGALSGAGWYLLSVPSRERVLFGGRPTFSDDLYEIQRSFWKVAMTLFCWSRSFQSDIC